MIKLMRIILASQNHGKLNEFIDIAKLASIKIDFEIKAITHDMGEIAETGVTYLENALLKAETVYAFYKQPVLADDSGLELTAFNNIPGVYSARFAGAFANAQQNRNKLCEFMQAKSMTSTPARYRCVLVYKPTATAYFEFTATWAGSITTKLKGTLGFGYDPMFIPENFTCTAAELASDTKNKISHRAKALVKFFNFLENKSSISNT